MDLYCPSYDHTLQLKLETITPSQIAMLDDGVQWKIFQYKDKVIGYLSWVEKMHIDAIAFNCPVAIVSLDEEHGVSPKLFNLAFKAQLGKINNSELLDELADRNVFIRGDRQVMDGFLYMNHVQTTEIYNLIRMSNPRGKSKKELLYNEKQHQLNGVIDTILSYERYKKKVLMQHKISQAHFYGLLFFYDGEKLCRDFYDKAFRYAYVASRTELSKALAEMYRMGLLSKRNKTRELKYNITSKGIDLLVKILNKLLYDV